MCARVAYTTQRRRANAHTAERNKNVYKIERREPWNGLRILLKFSISLCVQFATKRNNRIGIDFVLASRDPQKGFFSLWICYCAVSSACLVGFFFFFFKFPFYQRRAVLLDIFAGCASKEISMALHFWRSMCTLVLLSMWVLLPFSSLFCLSLLLFQLRLLPPYDIVSRKGGKGTVVLVQHNKTNRSPAHHVFKHHQSIVFSCFFVLSYSTADAADAALRSSPISYI